MNDPFEPLEAEADEDLWLVSYADLLTLLIAFFVVLASAAPMKAAALEAVAASMTGASPPPLTALKGKVEQLIADRSLSGSVRTREDAQGLGIEFRDAVLFPSGSADLRPEAGALIGKVATLLEELPGRRIVVEGHTDDVPIHNAEYASNWQLSSERAIRVVRALEEAGVSHQRLSLEGYADTRPAEAEPNMTEDARRAASRRVVIRVE